MVLPVIQEVRLFTSSDWTKPRVTGASFPQVASPCISLVGVQCHADFGHNEILARWAER